MKKITLLVAGIFLIGGVANASEIMKVSDVRSFFTNFNDAEPITFIERGIAFYIFPDGQFDFNSEPSVGDTYYRNGKRGGTNSTYGAPSTLNSGVIVEHDSQGRVRRVGNVFVNYDANDRIKRIGSVYMTYKNQSLIQVGGLQIIYNRRGQIIDMIGAVKGRTQIANSGNNYNNNPNNGNNASNQNNVYYRTKEADKVKTR